MSEKLTKAQFAALDMMNAYGRIRKNAEGKWSRYPNGGFNSRTIWDLEQRGLCSRSIHEVAQITPAGRAALQQDNSDE